MSEQHEQKQHEQKMMAGCEKFEAALEDYASGELPRRDARRLTAHLEMCRECREALEDARLSGRLVTVFSEAVDPGPGFTQRVMAQIHVAEHWVREQRSFWRPIEAWSWRLAFSAVLAIALLFAYDLKTASVASTPATQTVSAQQNDVFVVPVSASSSSGDEVLMAIEQKHHDQ